ncbi:MAG: GNAT family N-acetyltransferase [Nitrosopumilus sp.]|nr:GNAT family N-acetyltransferase [Nitrosopumilus sp.]
MKILRDKNHSSQELLLSQEIPSVMKNNIEYSIKSTETHQFSDVELNEISNFYRKYHRVNNSNNIILVSVDDLKKFLNTKVQLIVMYTKEGEILGSIMTFIFPSNIDTNLNKKINVSLSSKILDFYGTHDFLLTACTSFLIVHPNYRKKGLGMVLIQESILSFYKMGGMLAYFMNNISRCNNSIPINIWYYPLNLSKLDSAKFPYPHNHKSLFIPKEDKRITQKVDNSNSIRAYEFYMNYVKDKKCKFLPGFNLWNKWVETFPTYIIINGNIIEGIFSFNNSMVWHSVCMASLNTGYILFCLGSQPSTLNKSLIEAKKSYDILIIYPVGDLTDEHISKVNAKKTSKLYINFYNLNAHLTAKDFYAPLF